METADPAREDWDHGSAAAASGGVTTVVEHTHAAPVLSADDLREKVGFVEGRSHVDFGLAAHAFPDTIENLAGLSDAGVSFVKAFTCTTHGVPGLDPARIRDLFRAAARANVRALVHCEDESITATDEERLKAALRADGSVLPEWRSTDAELTAAVVVGVLARLTGAAVTVAHASQPSVVDVAVRERGLGAKLTIETCPQYLTLTEEEVARIGALRKFTPPARPAPAGEQLWEALRDGTVDIVSADHAPSTLEQKLTGSIWECPFGLPGVETVLPILLRGCQDGRLEVEDVVRLYSENPAKLLGLFPTKGSLQPGTDADLILIDPSATRVLTNDQVISKAGWTPFEGREVGAPPVRAYLRGTLIAEQGRPVSRDSPGGKFVRPIAP
jgi:dihydroorotase (multifunctional complex type)